MWTNKQSQQCCLGHGIRKGRRKQNIHNSELFDYFYNGHESYLQQLFFKSMFCRELKPADLNPNHSFSPFREEGGPLHGVETRIHVPETLTEMFPTQPDAAILSRLVLQNQGLRNSCLVRIQLDRGPQPSPGSPPGSSSPCNSSMQPLTATANLQIPSSLLPSRKKSYLLIFS